MNFVTTPESAIPRQSLTSAVADKLREEIIRGTIPEGAQLRQDAIAMQYQVSRIPVREALRQLDAEGLITIVPNRGGIVPSTRCRRSLQVTQAAHPVRRTVAEAGVAGATVVVLSKTLLSAR